MNEGLSKVNLTEMEFKFYSNQKNYKERFNHIINRRKSKGDLAFEAGAATSVKT